MKYTFYTGIWNKDQYEKYWKENNIVDQLTNVSTNYDEALLFAGDDKLVLKIENVPLASIVGFRRSNYKSDDDWVDLSNYSDIAKQVLYDTGGLFLINLFPVKNSIHISLVKE